MFTKSEIQLLNAAQHANDKQSRPSSFMILSVIGCVGATLTIAVGIGMMMSDGILSGAQTTAIGLLTLGAICGHIAYMRLLARTLSVVRKLVIQNPSVLAAVNPSQRSD